MPHDADPEHGPSDEQCGEGVQQQAGSAADGVEGEAADQQRDASGPAAQFGEQRCGHHDRQARQGEHQPDEELRVRFGGEMSLHARQRGCDRGAGHDGHGADAEQRRQQGSRWAPHSGVSRFGHDVEGKTSTKLEVKAENAWAGSPNTGLGTTMTSMGAEALAAAIEAGDLRSYETRMRRFVHWGQPAAVVCLALPSRLRAS